MTLDVVGFADDTDLLLFVLFKDVAWLSSSSRESYFLLGRFSLRELRMPSFVTEPPLGSGRSNIAEAPATDARPWDEKGLALELPCADRAVRLFIGISC